MPWSLDVTIKELDGAVEEAAHSRAEAVRLMTHPGVSSVVSLAFVLTPGSRRPFPEQPQAGQLPGAEPGRALQRRAAAFGADQQAGELDDALAVGGGGADGGPLRSGVAARLSTTEVSARQRGSQSGDCPPAGGPIVLDAA